MAELSLIIEGEGSLTRSSTFHFRYARGVIAHVPRINGTRTHEVLLRFGSWVGIVAPHQINAGDEVHLEVESPDVSAIQISPGSSLLAPEIVRMYPPIPAEYLSDLPGIPDPELRSAQLHNLSLISVQVAPAVHRRPSAMFWQLDAQTVENAFRKPPTSQTLIGKESDFRNEAIICVLKVLKERVCRRYREGPFPPEKVHVPRRLIVYISELLLGILESWYGGFQNQASTQFANICDAFEKFAAGVLYLKRPWSLRTGNHDPFVSDGAPNSPQYMLFAEFALLAIQFDIDRDQWAALFRPILASQFLYRVAYLDSTRRISYSAALQTHLKCGPNLSEGQCFGATAKLRSLCHEELVALFTSNLREFFSEPFSL